MSALVITLLILLVIAFPYALITSGGKILRLPDGLFTRHKVTAGLHFASIFGSVVLGFALRSVEIIAVGVYVTAAFNTFILRLCSSGENPAVFLYNGYLVIFWAGVLYLPAGLGVKAPF